MANDGKHPDLIAAEVEKLKAETARNIAEADELRRPLLKRAGFYGSLVPGVAAAITLFLVYQNDVFEVAGERAKLDQDRLQFAKDQQAERDAELKEREADFEKREAELMAREKDFEKRQSSVQTNETLLKEREDDLARRSTELEEQLKANQEEFDAMVADLEVRRQDLEDEFEAEREVLQHAVDKLTQEQGLLKKQQDDLKRENEALEERRAQLDLELKNATINGVIDTLLGPESAFDRLRFFDTAIDFAANQPDIEFLVAAILARADGAEPIDRYMLLALAAHLQPQNIRDIQDEWLALSKELLEDPEFQGKSYSRLLAHVRFGTTDRTLWKERCDLLFDALDISDSLDQVTDQARDVFSCVSNFDPYALTPEEVSLHGPEIAGQAFEFLSQDQDFADSYLAHYFFAQALKYLKPEAGDRYMGAVLGRYGNADAPLFDNVLETYVEPDEDRNIKSQGTPDRAWWIAYAEENPDKITLAGVLEALTQ